MADLTTSANVDSLLAAADYAAMRTLLNVEDGADVTDTANVTAAGALMDSELADLAGVKAVTISTLQVKPAEGAFVDGDKTKLDGIEASADVTDATNVAAAGALMTSALGTGVATALGNNVGSAGAPVVLNGALGTPTSGDLRACSGTKLVTKQTATSYTSGTTNALENYGGVIYVTGAATITLPAVADGMSVTIITIGAVAVSVDPNAADLIYLDGTALDDGDKITNLSTAGDIAVLTYYDATGWHAVTNGWTDGGA